MKILKRAVLLALSAVTALAFAACTKSGGEVGEIADFYAYKDNTLYSYTNGDGSFAYSLYTLYTGGGAYQYRLDSPNNSFVEVTTIKNGELRLTVSGSYAGFANLLSAAPTTDALLLKQPLKKGAKWVQKVGTDGQIDVEVTSVDKKITVPYGTFTALELTLKYPGNRTELHHYAKGLGLIRKEVTNYRHTTDMDGNLLEDVTTEHTSIELASVTERSYDALLAVFAPNESGRIVYETADISIHTDEDINKFVIAELKKNLDKSGKITISSDTALTSVAADKAEYKMTLDFSASFKSDMQNSPAGEAAAFKSVISALCYFYSCYYVKVTAGGEEYFPDGIDLNDEGYFESVTLTDANPDYDPNEYYEDGSVEDDE